MKKVNVFLITVAVFLIPVLLQAAPLGSAFTYQGALAEGGVDVTDTCDFNFRLWDASAGGMEVAMAVEAFNVSVTDGLFTVELDFGSGGFNGDARWLEVSVACPAGGGLTTLAPRQELTPSPNALFAASSGSMDWSGLTGVPAGLDDGDDVNDADADPVNELQDLSLGGNMLSLTGDASPVDLSGYLDNTDQQTLSNVLTQGNNAGGMPMVNIASLDVSGGIVAGGLVSGLEGLYVDDTPNDGLFIFRAGNHASSGVSGLPNGVEIRAAENDGLMVGANGGDGVDIWNAQQNGLYVRNAGDHGLRITNAAQNGIDIGTAGGYGIFMADNTAPSYFAGDMGIGVDPPVNRLHVIDSISGAASAANHVVQIENASSSGSADVLVLKINESPMAIDSGNNFISFHGASGGSLGAVEGNGGGSVMYSGMGADYAEYLPRLDPNEKIRPGQIVGVHQGRVSLTTQSADFLLAASTGAIVAGNDPGEELRGGFVLASFIGQVELQVRGPVRAGDLILASGENDGVGIAVSAGSVDARLAAKLVGQAWESASDPGVKPVRSLVGLVRPQVLTDLLQEFEARLEEIERVIGLY